MKERVKTLRSEIAKAKEDDDKILDFMMLIYKYNSFEELTPEILRAFIEKVVVHEKTKVDGHYRQTVESSIISSERSTDRYGATNSLTMIETDKQQEKRRGITPRLTLNLAPLPKIPYGNCGNIVFFIFSYYECLVRPQQFYVNTSSRFSCQTT